MLRCIDRGVKLPRRRAVVDGLRQADLRRAVIHPDVFFCQDIPYNILRSSLFARAVLTY